MLFGVVSLCSAVWCYMCLKETATCQTDKEKKELYIPEDLLELEQSEVIKGEISMGFAYGNSIDLD